MDAIDRDILRQLEQNGRMRWGELAAAVHLSPNAAAERVRRLERGGVISGLAVRRDWTASGQPIHAFMDIKLAVGVNPKRLETELAMQESIVEAHHMTGAYDYLVVGHFRDLAQVDEVISQLKAHGLVAETQTRFVLRSAAFGRD